MGIWKNISSDYMAAKRNDPAIPDGLRGFLEIVFCTPGFLAITAHRGIHCLHTRWHIPVLPRFISLIVRWWTGIEIHPAAQIGEGFFIDHGAGVVIGETAVVGDDCVIYQGATLGGTGKETGKRHPTLGKNVMVGCGARVLGPITIGDNVKIAANAVVLSDLPPNSTAVGVPARIVKRNGVRVKDDMVDQIHIPDPVSQELCRLRLKVAELERRLDARGQGDGGGVPETRGDAQEPKKERAETDAERTEPCGEQQNAQGRA